MCLKEKDRNKDYQCCFCNKRINVKNNWSSCLFISDADRSFFNENLISFHECFPCINAVPISQSTLICSPVCRLKHLVKVQNFIRSGKKRVKSETQSNPKDSIENIPTSQCDHDNLDCGCSSAKKFRSASSLISSIAIDLDMHAQSQDTDDRLNAYEKGANFKALAHAIGLNYPTAATINEQTKVTVSVQSCSYRSSTVCVACGARFSSIDDIVDVTDFSRAQLLQRGHWSFGNKIHANHVDYNGVLSASLVISGRVVESVCVDMEEYQRLLKSITLLFTDALSRVVKNKMIVFDQLDNDDMVLLTGWTKEQLHQLLYSVKGIRTSDNRTRLEAALMYFIKIRTDWSFRHIV